MEKRHLQDAKIRRAEKSDAESIIKFNCAMALETEDKILPVDKITQGVHAVFDRSGYGHYLIAEYRGEIAGCCMITYEWSDWRNGLFWWIQSVYVEKEFRRKGVFRAMYAYILKQAEKDLDVCGLRLYVERENMVAQKTYTSLGMEETRYRLYEFCFDGKNC